MNSDVNYRVHLSSVWIIECHNFVPSWALLSQWKFLFQLDRKFPPTQCFTDLWRSFILVLGHMWSSVGNINNRTWAAEVLWEEVYIAETKYLVRSPGEQDSLRQAFNVLLQPWETVHPQPQKCRRSTVQFILYGEDHRREISPRLLDLMSFSTLDVTVKYVLIKIIHQWPDGVVFKV